MCVSKYREREGERERGAYVCTEHILGNPYLPTGTENHCEICVFFSVSSFEC